jgi:hypothetical protein
MGLKERGYGGMNWIHVVQDMIRRGGGGSLYELSGESSGKIFVEYLSDYQLPKKNFAVWCWLIMVTIIIVIVQWELNEKECHSTHLAANSEAQSSVSLAHRQSDVSQA